MRTNDGEREQSETVYTRRRFMITIFEGIEFWPNAFAFATSARSFVTILAIIAFLIWALTLSQKRICDVANKFAMLQINQINN